MIELVAVLIVIGIISTIITARILSISSFDLKSETDIIKNHLRYAQSRAMSSNGGWGIYFSDTTHYALFKNGTTDNTQRLPGEDSNFIELGSKKIVLGNLETGVISFNSWGVPHTDARAGTVQNGTRNILLSISGNSVTATISITPNTGFIP